MPLPPELLQVYCNTTFLFFSYFTLLLPFLFAFYLPAVLILLCCFLTLHLIVFPYLLSQFLFPGFCPGSPFPRSFLGGKGSRELPLEKSHFLPQEQRKTFSTMSPLLCHLLSLFHLNRYHSNLKDHKAKGRGSLKKDNIKL